MNHENLAEFPYIKIENYLKPSLELNEIEKKIQKNVIDKTPDIIIDFHVHTGLPIHAKLLHSDFYKSLNSTYPYFSLELHRKTNLILWENKKIIKRVVFTFPFYGIDIKNANEYIQSQKDSCTIPFLTGDLSDLDYTIKEIKSGRWYGIKANPNQQIPRAKKIKEFCPPSLLEVANKSAIPIIIHLPRDLFTNGEELRETAKSYPNSKFIIAHAGNVRKIEGKNFLIFNRFKKTPNVFFDTSCVVDTEIILTILKTLGANRLIFASDQPLNLISAIPCYHPTLGNRGAVDTSYHWADPEEQRYYRESFGINLSSIPNLHFGSLKAIIDAINILAPDKNVQNNVKEKIFYQNAFQILNSSL